MIKIKKTNYVNNAKLLEDLREYKRLLNEGKKPKISNYVGKCIMLIAENLATMPKFHNYSFKDEMIADGIENVILYIYNFDPDKYNNPFAYITKIVYYAFLRRIAKEKKHLYVKYKSASNYGIFDAVTNTEANSGTAPFEMYDNLSKFIEDFETKRKDKKDSKVKGVEKFVETI